jgi:hypothetical protein
VSPEIAIALITVAGTILAAVVAAVPAVLALFRRTAGAVAAEGTATRDALDGIANALNQRIADVRDDIDGVREDVARVREWQAGHDAEHLLIGRPRPRGEA